MLNRSELRLNQCVIIKNQVLIFYHDLKFARSTPVCHTIFTLNLNLNESDQSAGVYIVNETGKTVYKKVISLQNGQLQTDLPLNGKLSDGVYFVIVTVNGKQYSSRFIIQNEVQIELSY